MYFEGLFSINHALIRKHRRAYFATNGLIIFLYVCFSHFLGATDEAWYSLSKKKKNKKKTKTKQSGKIETPQNVCHSST
jgi:hypothetical protein